jgi:hypothetical protein
MESEDRSSIKTAPLSPSNTFKYYLYHMMAVLAVKQIDMKRDLAVVAWGLRIPPPVRGQSSYPPLLSFT